MEEAATQQHAHPNTVYHCLYAYYKFGYSKQHLAHVFIKSLRTLSNWIKTYEDMGVFQRCLNKLFPLINANGWSISTKNTPSRIWTKPKKPSRACIGSRYRKLPSGIIHESGLTWKVLERRAMYIKEQGIFRFTEELIFLDEVSFDNRGMIRKRGYTIKGKKLAIRGDF
ncbi:hypothetical protein PHMEG_00012780 [Phytophthora megakarya]|uniref:Uncharacterized protein n=1 Tax=Phytophthora megakarya TaxID=4795 RepID=A0A225W7W1_9STRA|nr:hypothetical protein PHMEG_00012780 [Phytophthora megakarya]